MNKNLEKKFSEKLNKIVETIILDEFKKNFGVFFSVKEPYFIGNACTFVVGINDTYIDNFNILKEKYNFLKLELEKYFNVEEGGFHFFDGHLELEFNLTLKE